ncbi:MAG TPA: DUF177 domain-containing protein [Geobacteraceae bacterium]
MRIRVSDITDVEKVFTFEEPVTAYPGLVETEHSGECSFLRPLSVELRIAREYDHIRSQGHVKTAVQLKCSRCLGEFSAEVSSIFTIFYCESKGEELDEEVELGETDLIAATYSGDEIDFAPEIAEQVLLELPYKPLCKEDCHGLCPNCGADLNLDPCSCAGSTASLAFTVLKDFKAKQ